MVIGIASTIIPMRRMVGCPSTKAIAAPTTNATNVDNRVDQGSRLKKSNQISERTAPTIGPQIMPFNRTIEVGATHSGILMTAHIARIMIRPTRQRGSLGADCVAYCIVADSCMTFSS